MEQAYFYLALSGMLTVLLWVPYIGARVFIWGIRDFLHNYPEGFPDVTPKEPLWVIRARRAHQNMVETLPAFVAVVVAAMMTVGDVAGDTIGYWASLFFYARVGHAIVYILAIPGVRTPVYLVSWLAILVIGAQVTF